MEDQLAPQTIKENTMPWMIFYFEVPNCPLCENNNHVEWNDMLQCWFCKLHEIVVKQGR